MMTTTTTRTTMMKRVSQFWDYNNGEDNEEENVKDDNKNKCDNNDKGISALGLDLAVSGQSAHYADCPLSAKEDYPGPEEIGS